MFGIEFYQHQYGFRLSHTTHPIAQLLTKCASDNNLKPKYFTAAIFFCDLSKAFDVIKHNILINKLEHYGITGIVKTWMVNYLTNRRQFVEFGGEKSEHCLSQAFFIRRNYIPVQYPIIVGVAVRAKNWCLTVSTKTSAILQGNHNLL